MFSSCVCYFYFSCKRKNVSHLISPFLKSLQFGKSDVFPKGGKKKVGREDTEGK